MFLINDNLRRKATKKQLDFQLINRCFIHVHELVVFIGVLILEIDHIVGIAHVTHFAVRLTHGKKKNRHIKFAN